MSQICRICGHPLARILRLRPLLPSTERSGDVRPMGKIKVFTAAANDGAPKTITEGIGDLRCSCVAQRGSICSAMIHIAG